MKLGFLGSKNFVDPPHEEFWTGFREYIAEQNSSLIHFGSLNSYTKLYDKFGEASYSGCEFGFEVFGEDKFRNIWMVGTLNTDKNWLSVKIQFNDKIQGLYETLKSNSDSIETHFDPIFKFEWIRIGNFHSAGLFRREIDINNKSCWAGLYEWIRENLELLERVFMNQLALYYYRDSTHKT